MPLADQFPKSYLENHLAGMPERIRAQIVPRTIIRLPSTLTTRPKPKLFLVVSIDPLCLFIISTEIFERYTRNTPRAIPHQIRITKKDNPCLDHDSYVDCWKFWEEFDMTEIVQRCCQNSGEIVGTICEQTAMLIIDAVCDCPTFSASETNLISQSLA